jgi:glycosyltransferase involved in cell wall biosynthesis
MKVLLLNRISQQRGGADKYFLELAQILSARGHSVGTFTAKCPGDPDLPNQDLFPSSFHEATTPPPSLGQKIRFFFDGIYSRDARDGLRRLLERNRPDVAHLNNIFFQLSSSVIDALAEARVPIIFSLHDYQLFCSNAYLYRDNGICTLCSEGRFGYGLKYRCYRGSFAASLMSYYSKKVTHDRRLTDRVSAFIVPAQSMRRQVESLGLRGARIEVIPNPFRIGGLHVRESWEPYVVFYGRLIRPKGIYTLLEASRRLPAIPLRLYGSGPEEEGVRRYLRDHAMSHVLLDTTLRWGPELEDIVARARYVVVPSEWPVPLDYTACESLALGRAVITADVGGNREIVGDGVGGRTYRAGDPEDLARVMSELYGDLPTLRQMGLRGRNAVETACAEDRYYERILNLYQDLARTETSA